VTGAATGAPDDASPWVETREGGYFFVNALLFIPELVVLVPLALKGLLFVLGWRGESVYVDTIPALAAYVLPWTGWLLVVPLWTTLRNLTMELPAPARGALLAMLAGHLGFLGWTVGHWLGVTG